MRISPLVNLDDGTGIISIISNVGDQELVEAPSTEEFEGAIKVDAGNYDSYGLGLAFSGPASDAVNYRLAANQYKSDGFSFAFA